MNDNISQNIYYDLLSECCKTTCNQEKLDNLASQITDWDALFMSAYLHGVFPLFYARLKSNPSISNNHKSTMKQMNLDITKNNLVMTGELLKTVALLKVNGIRALAIKGPVLSQMIHNDVTKRQFTDLDLLVEPSQMYKAVEILTKNDYKPQYDIKFLTNKTLLKVGKDFPIEHTKNHVLIEFHWKLFLDRYIKKSNINLFSQNNYHCSINQTLIETLEINALLLYLLLHGSRHYWERIEWIVDIDRLIQKYTNEIDWQLLSKMAKDMQIEFYFYLGLAVSAKVLDTRLEASFEKYIDDDEYIQKALATIVQEIYADSIKKEHSDIVSLENLNKIFMMKDKSYNWFRQYFMALFQLKELDVYVLNLPHFLSPLYYLVRLYRLFKENILHLK